MNCVTEESNNILGCSLTGNTPTQIEGTIFCV